MGNHLNSRSSIGIRYTLENGESDIATKRRFKLHKLARPAPCRSRSIEGSGPLFPNSPPTVLLQNYRKFGFCARPDSCHSSLLDCVIVARSLGSIGPLSVRSQWRVSGRRKEQRRRHSSSFSAPYKRAHVHSRRIGLFAEIGEPRRHKGRTASSFTGLGRARGRSCHRTDPR